MDDFFRFIHIFFGSPKTEFDDSESGINDKPFASEHDMFHDIIAEFENMHRNFGKHFEEIDKLHDRIEEFELFSPPSSSHGHFGERETMLKDQGNSDNSSARDSMLKRPDVQLDQRTTRPITGGETDKSQNEPHKRTTVEKYSSTKPEPKQPTLFHRLFQFSKPNIGRSSDRDSDLDNRQLPADLDSLFSNSATDSGNFSPSDPRCSQYESPVTPGFSFASKHTSIRKVLRPDGMMEETRTSRDSTGHEVTKTTRRLGDKEYVQERRRKSDGTEETTEHFVNVSEDEKKYFSQRDTPKLSEEDDMSDISIFKKWKFF